MVGRFVDFHQAHVVATDDRHDHALGAAHRHTVEQRVGDRLFRRLERTAVAFRLAGAHHRLAHFAHHRTDVGKVEVDEARHDHQVGDRAHALLQHLVRHLERFLEGRVRVGDQEQILVRDDDQRVDMLLQLVDAAFRRLHAAIALEGEGLGHDADGQDALFTRRLGDDRGRTGAGAAAHAGGDEAHMGAFQRLFDGDDGFFRSRATDFGARTGAQTLGDLRAKLDAPFGRRGVQRLRVGVGDDEVDALDAGRDHVRDGVTACTANAYHRNAWLQFVHMRRADLDAHILCSLSFLVRK